MIDNYLTFKKFNHIELANEIGEVLKANNIDYSIEDNKKFFDVNFSNTSLENDVSLNLKPADFERAHMILDEFYKQQIQTVPLDYYLFDFSDQELLEIISKPDEWGEFDYHLSQKILVDRGKEIKTDIVDLLSTQRNNELSKPELTNKYLIYRGYIAALFGGIFAIMFGYDLAYSKKTLRNGKQVYTYKEIERKHGKRIVLIGVISLIIWIGVILILRNQGYTG